MSSRPLVAVADATGLLGGSVARAILNDPQQRFTLRALVRHASAPAARALAHAGAQVLEVEHDDATSMLRGFGGAVAAFAVTDFWVHGSPERELSQARAMATAARLADLEHVIWSTQGDSRTWMALTDSRLPTLLQRYKVPQFDAKGEADTFFSASGVPVTFLRTAIPWEQLLSFGMGPRRAEDGGIRLAIPLGARQLPGIALGDVGRIVLALLAGGAPMAPRMMGVASETLTGDQLARAFGRALGESVTYGAVSFDTWRRLGLPGADEQANQFQFMHDFNDAFVAQFETAVSRELCPGIQSFGEWLQGRVAQIPHV